MAATRDCTIILFDVGANSSVCDKLKGKTFFEEAKSCIESAITRKIFTKPKDELSLFLVGTKGNDNHLGYDNISHALEMAPMSWDILKYVQQSIDPPSEGVTGDWVAGIIVATDYFHNLALEKCSKKILLFTTFDTDVNDESKKEVIDGLKAENIELIVVTKNVIYEMDEDSEDPYANFSQGLGKDKIQEKAENLIKDIVVNTDGILCSIDDAASKLSYVDKKSRKRMPWNCDLTIGSLLTIKISAYIYVRKESDLPTWKNVTQRSDVHSDGQISTQILNVSSKTEYYHNDERLGPDAVAESLVRGYMYGDEPIPFEEWKFDNGGKGLKFIGFTKVDLIRDEHFVGDSIWVVVPQKNMPTSARRLAAMIKAMQKSNLAIIARYTYRGDSAPKLMALLPGENSLYMYELFFKDNVLTGMKFPRLNSNATTPSPEQLQFMDKFIDSMDLTNDDTKMDVDQPAQNRFNELLDPGLQYQYRAIAHRAINPNEPLLKVDQDIMNLLTAPNAAAIDVDGLKTHFPVKEVKLTNKEVLLKNIRDAQQQGPVSAPAEQKPDYSDIHEIGTVKPADDFMKLFERGERFDTLSAQLQEVIVKLVTKSLVAMDEKILQALLAYREIAKTKAAYKYNDWIATFKQLLVEREKIQLWQNLINESLGLITAKESEMSMVSEEEAQTFAKLDDLNTQKAQPNDSGLEESNFEMFEDM